MDLNTLIRLVLVFACPIGMGAMLWTMSKNASQQPGPSMPNAQTRAERLGALRARREALEADIAEAARLTELEARREASFLEPDSLVRSDTGQDELSAS